MKINYVQSFIKKRNKIADIYNKNINNNNIILPYTHKDASHSYNQYTIRVNDRKKLEKYLNKNNVPFGVYYTQPIYNYNAYKSKGYKPLPMAEKVSKQCLSLPIYPELPMEHVKKICNILNNFDG